MKALNLLGAVGVAVLASSAYAGTGIVLDFETDDNSNPIVQGQIIDDEFDGLTPGITLITATKKNGDPALAVIFDSSNAADAATADDEDLLTPAMNDARAFGNILIIAEGNPSSTNGVLDNPPDDEAGGGSLNFALNFVATFGSIIIHDTDDGEDDGFIEFFLLGASQGTVAIADVGNNKIQDLTFMGMFDEFQVNLDSSGAVAEVTLRGQIIPTPTAFALGLAPLAGLAGARRRRAC